MSILAANSMGAGPPVASQLALKWFSDSSDQLHRSVAELQSHGSDRHVWRDPERADRTNATALRRRRLRTDDGAKAFLHSTASDGLEPEDGITAPLSDVISTVSPKTYLINLKH